jgi:peptidoglycan hydrolase-like protein with peptidoglycan-binding domain
VRASVDRLDRVKRNLGSEELWARSLERSRRRRGRALIGEPTPRSLVSAALLDLDGPFSLAMERAPDHRDLSDPEVCDISLARARAKRRAADPGFLPQARVAGASLLVAAVAAAVPAQGGAHSRARSAGEARSHVELLRTGSRGPAVAKVQRALGIPADGIFGPQTRAAVKKFQRSHGLLVDGIVGPQTRAAFARGSGGGEESSFLKFGSRGPAVAALQRKLGIPADGIFGPQTRSAVRAFQAKHNLIVDGIVGPQTRAALRGAGGGGSGSSRDSGSGRDSGSRRDRSSSPRAVRGVDKRLWRELALARRMGLTLVSAYRRGSTLPSGRRSDHGYYPSRAIDVAGSPRSMRRYARAVAGNPGVDIVIHSPVGIWQAGVGWRQIDDSTTRREHYDHVHVDTF